MYGFLFVQNSSHMHKNCKSFKGRYMGRMEFAGCSKVHGTFLVKQYSSLVHSSEGERFLNRSLEPLRVYLVNWTLETGCNVLISRS